MKTELYRKALEKVGNANVLINIVSKRVKQLTSGGGSMSRPLLDEYVGYSAAEIAMREIVDEKFEWSVIEEGDEEAA